ncbi:response regulator transcription factor [Candidatus Bipolaricaulota bacterium]|nr:response regulator transcription factor [Candidatus Bipolaricaulota bacterium]
MPGIRIAIVDDHALVRAGLVRLLSARYDVIGEAADAASALALVRRASPDLLLLDLSLPDRDGLSAIPDLIAASPNTRILVLTMYDEPEYAAAAVAAGACGLVSKSASADTLYAAIDAAVKGTLERPSFGLTEREQDVLSLLGEGKEDAEIAALLGISPRTVANHCARLMEKLGIHTRAGLIAHARRIRLEARD